MCTVTFVPTQNGYILTSSRDEQKARPTIFPKKYSIGDKMLIFPKDELAGGTWIATDEKHRTACLLNGAFENHIKKERYRKSRGLILLESFAFSSINDFSNQVDLENIEPFTLLLIDSSPNLEFVEMRWDGTKKYIKNIDINLPQIWSSATLYPAEVRKKREDWFEKLIASEKSLSKETIQNFHFTKKDSDVKNDIVMEREGGLQTLSISQVIVEQQRKEFTYFDIVTNKHHSLIVYEN
ncbi:MAG: NRDE family protein [Flavobacteriales bacterium]|nr:NRDE family protein [Flavobacteriales bacterium]MCB9175301.1 NRDE family protein [Flavobacteriales bacterium]